MDLVFIHLKMDEDTKVNGKMTKKMEKVEDILFIIKNIFLYKIFKLIFNLSKGIFTWPNGDIYEGELKDDKRNGFGINIYNDGRRYEGEWKNDKINGKGFKIFFLLINYL